MKSGLLTAALLLLVLGIVMFFAQRPMLFPRHMAFSPPTRGPAEPTTWAEGSGLLLVPDSARPAPLFIFFHGNAETAGNWVDEFEAMRRDGWATLLVEYPGYAGTPGTPSETSIIRAANGAFDWATRDRRIDSSRIVAWGRSLGSGPAARLAADRPVSALILESGFTGVAPLAALFLVPRFLVRDPFDNLAALRRYHGPLLVIHGVHDEVIPFAHGEALAAAVPGATFITVECGHNDCPRPWSIVSDWLRARGLGD